MDGDALRVSKPRFQVLAGGAGGARRAPVRQTRLPGPMAPDPEDFVDPEMPLTDIERAIAQLRLAAQSGTRAQRCEGIVDAMEHLAREIASMHGEDAARTALLRISARLRHAR